MKLKRIISALLLLAMLLSCLPFTALAVEGENYFYFSAETTETLVVSPQKIPYSDGQTIAEALETAGISLTFDSGSGFVSAIQGVESEYLRERSGGTLAGRFGGGCQLFRILRRGRRWRDWRGAAGIDAGAGRLCG